MQSSQQEATPADGEEEGEQGREEQGAEQGAEHGAEQGGEHGAEQAGPQGASAPEQASQATRDLDESGSCLQPMGDNQLPMEQGCSAADDHRAG